MMKQPGESRDGESELRELIGEHLENEDWESIRKALSGLPSPHVADTLKALNRPNRRATFAALPRRLAADILSHFSPERAQHLLEHLDENHRREILDHLEPEDRVELLEDLPEEMGRELLGLLDETEQQETRGFLEYPEQSVGRLTTPRCITIRPGWTVQKALDHVRQEGEDSEIISILYVVDSDRKLIDTVRLRTLILAERDELVELSMDRKYESLSPYDDREVAVDALARYDIVALPVVDEAGIFLGIVTVDDILDVAEEEATEDFHKYGAVQPLERTYSGSTPWNLYRSRIGWLLVLILVNLMSSGVIAFFESTLEQVIVLAFFIPLLIGSGGNTGAQAATLMVRAIATDDLKLNQWLTALLKELGIGLILGLTMGLAASLLGFTYGGVGIGMIVGLSMMGIVIVANTLGTILPFVLTRLGIDPAVASSPLITTIADVTGLLVYFSIATVFLEAGLVTV